VPAVEEQVPAVEEQVPAVEEDAYGEERDDSMAPGAFSSLQSQPRSVRRRTSTEPPPSSSLLEVSEAERPFAALPGFVEYELIGKVQRFFGSRNLSQDIVVCLAFVLKLFLDADSDNSGSIEAEELCNALHRWDTQRWKKQRSSVDLLAKINAVPIGKDQWQKQLEPILKAYDVDGNGSLDFNEFVSLAVMSPYLSCQIDHAKKSQLIMVTSGITLDNGELTEEIQAEKASPVPKPPPGKRGELWNRAKPILKRNSIFKRAK